MTYDERRINKVLLNYWEALRGAKEYPSFDAINPEDIEDIWDHCFVIRIQPGNKFNYSYLGKDIIHAYGEDLTGQEVYSTLLSFSDENFLIKLEELMDIGQPIIDEAEFINAQNLTIRYRRCLLPLGDNTTIQHVIGGMRWKIYT